jgi:hypothetical protein
MNNPFVIFLSIVLIVSGSLFYDQVLAIFRAMTPLEAMQQIATFVLHVIVVTILGYVAITVNHIVRPWVRMFQQKQRTVQKNFRRARKSSSHSAQAKPIKQSRLTLDQVIKIVGMMNPPAYLRRDHKRAKPRVRFPLDY